LLPEAIRKVKFLCANKKAILIPYRISKYLPHICECLGLELFAGTFNSEANAILFEEGNDLPKPEKSQGKGKFKRLNESSLELLRYYRERMSRIRLSNSLYHSKTAAK
jgi:hypothetical protein